MNKNYSFKTTMNNRETKNAKKPLHSLETNIFKHKRTLQDKNHVNKANRETSFRESLLRREELIQLWVQYYTYGHFRDENSDLMKNKSRNISKNEDETDENFTASQNTQSIRIVSTNTWNWAQVTEINQSNKSMTEVNPKNIRNDTSDVDDFAKVFINEKWSQDKNTSILSNTESNGSELYNNNDLIFNHCSEMLEPNQHEPVNNQFTLDNYKENLDPNIFSDFEYNNYYNQYNHGMNGNHNISCKINVNQNSDQIINNHYWCNDNRNNFVQSSEADFSDVDNLDYTIYNNLNELNSSGDSLLEYFSL